MTPENKILAFMVLYAAFIAYFLLNIPAAHATTVSVDGFGTGTYVSNDGYVLTNAHVVTNDGTKNYSIVVKVGNAVYPAVVIAIDKVNDLALVKIISSATTSCIQVETNGDMINKHSYQMVHFDLTKGYGGFPNYALVSTPVIATQIGWLGTVSDKPWIGTHYINIFSTKDGRPGNSGSPILSDNNKLLDVNEVGNSENTIGGSVSNAAVRAFLNNNQISCAHPTNDVKSVVALVVDYL